MDKGLLNADIIARIQALKQTIQLSNKTLDKTPITSCNPTLKANLRAKNAKIFKEEYKQNAQKKLQTPVPGPHIDRRLKLKSFTRKKRTFNFNTPGTYQKLGHKMRMEQRINALKESVSRTTNQIGIATTVKLATIQPKRMQDESYVPDMEWWDSNLMLNPETKYNDIVVKDGNVLNVEKFVDMRWIDVLIEHPPKLRMALDTVTEIPLLLTKTETKKLRRQTRAELQKEEQEKIRLGLAKPPVAKVRMANLMRVLGTEAVQDPTKVEAYVLSQMEQRKRNHETANAQRKLSKEESREKKIAKLQENSLDRTEVAVYKIKNLSQASHRFKIETNANQLFMTGIVALNPTCNVVVVEGNARKQKKFKRLMLHRIDWNQDARRTTATTSNDNRDGQSTGLNTCELIWEGAIKCPAFSKIEFKNCPTELYAREQFRKCDVEQYWDLAYSKEVLQAAGELARD